MNYNVGIIGMGIFGKAHLDVLRSLDNVNVIYVYDKNPNIIEMIKTKYPDLNVAKSMDDLLRNKDIEVIHVTTDENSHFSIGKKVLLAEKHLFIEKPITSSYSEANQLYEIAKKKNKKVGVGHLLRHEKKHRSLKESIEKGEIGELKVITLKRNFSKSMLEHYGRINAYITAMVHDLDLVQYFSEDRIKKVAGYQTIPHKNSYFFNTAYLETKKGITAQVENIWLLPENYPYGMDYEVSLYGTEGMLRTSINADIELYGKNISFKELFLDTALLEELKYFINIILNNEVVNTPTIEEAIHNIEIAEKLVDVANIGVRDLKEADGAYQYV
nr:Gfo/Idh/MocA family oxidoreductase [Terribacillus saccharophilus]